MLGKARSICSDRLNRNLRKVVDQADFALHERFAVSHASEQAVMACFGEGAFADFFFRDE